MDSFWNYLSYFFTDSQGFSKGWNDNKAELKWNHARSKTCFINPKMKHNQMFHRYYSTFFIDKFSRNSSEKMEEPSKVLPENFQDLFQVPSSFKKHSNNRFENYSDSFLEILSGILFKVSQSVISWVFSGIHLIILTKVLAGIFFRISSKFFSANYSLIFFPDLTFRFPESLKCACGNSWKFSSRKLFQVFFFVKAMLQEFF